MGILIDNRQNRFKINRKEITQKARVILNALDCPDGELSLLLVDDERIAALNLEYLQREGPTNVIAFPMQEGEFPKVNPNLLGDVVISLDTALKEADAAGMTLLERFDQLLVHGILHLFGYDHVHNGQEALEMDAKARELAALIGCPE